MVFGELHERFEKLKAQLREEGLFDEKYKKETWEYGRIDKSSIALIKLAIIEIEYLNIPYKIVINECINICKKYSEEKNTKFINGILANYIKIKGIK